MSQVTETICDHCGARKGKSNGWFRMRIDPITFVLAHNGEGGEGSSFTDICSSKCASEELNEFMYPKVVAEEHDPHREVGMQTNG